MKRPLIAVTTRLIKPEQLYLNAITRTFTDALELAGAAPILLPLGIGQDSLREIFGRVDGVMLSGGVDVHPREYGEGVEPFCGEIMRERDIVELPLTRWALAENKPLLGICRGIQILNVAAGGSLYQDIRAQLPNALPHAQQPGDPYDRRVHRIDIEPDSLLARALGATRVDVNSLHHQSVKEVAPSLRVVARAPDGVIEAIEAKDGFALGMQFHPELLLPDEQILRIFQAFVARAA